MYQDNREQIDSIILEELSSDPEGRWYDAASLEEKVSLLNSPYTKVEPNPDYPGEDQTETILVEKLPRIYLIMIGVPFSPNAVCIEDLERLGV
jgi:hypothetical protein